MPSVHEQYDEAIAVQQQGDLEGAVAKLQALLAEQPNYALAHAAMSVFCEKLGRGEDAIDHARKVCELEPDDPFSYMAMSLVCQKVGNIAEAEKALSLAMEKQWAARQA